MTAKVWDAEYYRDEGNREVEWQERVFAIRAEVGWLDMDVCTELECETCLGRFSMAVSSPDQPAVMCPHGAAYNSNDLFLMHRNRNICVHARREFDVAWDAARDQFLGTES